MAATRLNTKSIARIYVSNETCETAFLTALCLSGLLALTGAKPAHADAVPVIEITAKRFAFSPDKITLKKGQTVKLRLHSEDVTHGFFLRPLHLDEEIPAGQTTTLP